TLLRALWHKKYRQRGFCFKFGGSSLAAIKPNFSGDITERFQCITNCNLAGFVRSTLDFTVVFVIRNPINIFERKLSKLGFGLSSFIFLPLFPKLLI
ncbi:hypothetical protein, partial [Photobacterium marinum]|uniref:hypothetical protein n=1 Tax=Photobacterium marinum TaxID=1056511 RepID=UPI001E5C50D5